MSQKKELEQHIELGKQAVEHVLRAANKYGATAAECALTYTKGLSVSSRMKDVETIEFNQDAGLGITLYQGQHKGSVSTADWSEQAIDAAVKKASQIAQYTEADPYAGLADASYMATEFPDLELFYEADLTPEHASQQAIACESHMLELDKRVVNSDGATYASYCGFRLYANSHGFLGHQMSSRTSLSCMPIAMQDDRMERDYAYTIARNPVLLRDPEEVAQEAVTNTVARLGARSVHTQEAPVIFHRDLANSLFGHLVSAISGANLYRKSSFLLDSLGETIFPSWLTIHEDPWVKGGWSSSAFDHNGVATKPRDIIHQGVLQTYLMTAYSARRLGYELTGHAGGIHNWSVQHTGQSLEELCQAMGTGLLVTELMGQGVNAVTGDYSRGASGFWVEKGKIKYPVTEVTIAGNLREMFLDIQGVATDADQRHGVQTGSIWIGKMKIAGQ